MMKDLSIEQSAMPIIRRVPRGTGTDEFSPTRQIHCNEDGMYLVKCSGDESGVKAYLIQGLSYRFQAINVLKEDGSALISGDEIILEN